MHSPLRFRRPSPLASISLLLVGLLATLLALLIVLTA